MSKISDLYNGRSSSPSLKMIYCVIMITAGELAKNWSWSHILEIKIKINFLQHCSGFLRSVTFPNRLKGPILKFSSKIAQIDWIPSFRCISFGIIFWSDSVLVNLATYLHFIYLWYWSWSRSSDWSWSLVIMMIFWHCDLFHPGWTWTWSEIT